MQFLKEEKKITHFPLATQDRMTATHRCLAAMSFSRKSNGPFDVHLLFRRMKCFGYRLRRLVSVCGCGCGCFRSKTMQCFLIGLNYREWYGNTKKMEMRAQVESPNDKEKRNEKCLWNANILKIIYNGKKQHTQFGMVSIRCLHLKHSIMYFRPEWFWSDSNRSAARLRSFLLSCVCLCVSWLHA